MPGSKKRPGWEAGPRPRRVARLRTVQARSARRRRNKMVSVPRNKMAFPMSMKTQLRFGYRQVLAPTGTGLTFASFRANSLYDPVYALGGAQPRGFDQFMAVYKTYTVTGAKVSVTFMYEGYDGPSTSSGTAYDGMVKQFGYDSATVNVPALSPCVVGIERATDVITGGEVHLQMEKDKNKWGYLTGSTGTKVVTHQANVRDTFGKAFAVGSEGYTGTDGTNPEEEILFNVWAARAHGSGDSSEKTRIVAFVLITYDAVFTEPKQLAAS